MLRIAARITNGAIGFTVQSPVGSHRRVPGSWDLSDDEDDWDMGEYGTPLGKASGMARRKTCATTWDVD